MSQHNTTLKFSDFQTLNLLNTIRCPNQYTPPPLLTGYAKVIIDKNSHQGKFCEHHAHQFRLSPPMKKTVALPPTKIPPQITPQSLWYDVWWCAGMMCLRRK